jgi:hypothetical protein
VQNPGKSTNPATLAIATSLSLADSKQSEPTTAHSQSKTAYQRMIRQSTSGSVIWYFFITQLPSTTRMVFVAY